MKRFIYHYFCLIYSIGQLVFFIECIDFWKRYSESGNLLSGSGVAGTIVIILCLFAIAAVDRFIRKANLFGFWFDSIILTLISPIRVVFELITIIRLHIDSINGNSSFGERGCEESFCYLVFNCEGGVHISLSKRPKKELVKEPKKEQPKKEQPKMNKAETPVIKKEPLTLEEEIKIANQFLKESRRSDWANSLYIVPFSNVVMGETNEAKRLFETENYGPSGDRYIDEIYVNGIKLVYKSKIDLTQALSLKPGSYDIKIHITGEIKSPSNKFKTIKINRYLSLDMVNISNKETYLCAIIDFNEKNQEVKYSFRNLTESEIEKMCSFWDLNKQDILEAEIKKR